jgi:branched-subunit amino acid ABC-type transport system permease component
LHGLVIAGAFTLAIIETFVATLFGVEWKSFAFFAAIILFVGFKPSGIAGVKIN